MISCYGTLINLKVPKIMGILNVTPDSFYDGGKYIRNIDILKHVEKMLNEGADFIDVGGCSSRPGANFITEKEEIKRVIRPINIILKHFPKTIISIDTYRSKVAYIAIKSGAQIINDVSGGTIDKKMFKTVAKLKVPYILNHIKGFPKNMQDYTIYDNCIIDINKFLSKKIFSLKLLGVKDIILDPGFGFGKNIKNNFQIIKYLPLIGFNNYPILIGLSRKSTLQKIINNSAKSSLNATSIMHTLTLLKGISILRVHDVKEAIQCIKIINIYNKIIIIIFLYLISISICY